MAGGQSRPPLDKPSGMGIMIDEGDAATSGQPHLDWDFIELYAHKNRHRAGWRFLFLSFCIRIEIE